MQSPEGRIFIRLPLGGDQLVDLAVGWRLGPDKAGSVPHHGHRRRGIVPLEPRQDRRLAAAHRRDQAGLAGHGDLGIGTFEERLAADVADLAVGVGRQHPELLLRADPLDDRVDREDRDLGHARRRQVELGTVGDPRAHDFVVRLARLHQGRRRRGEQPPVGFSSIMLSSGEARLTCRPAWSSVKARTSKIGS